MDDSSNAPDAARRHGLGRGLSALFGDYDSKPVAVTPKDLGGGPAAAPPAAEIPAPPPMAGSATIAAMGPQTIPLGLIRRNPQQPRRRFNEDDLAELTASIKTKGVLQPIVLRPINGASERYEIVAGERRWRAAQRAGLDAVPAIVRELDDLQVLEIALVENLQRADLDPIEEAEAYKQLIDRFGRTQDAVAEAMGKSRSHVANMMRLLNLPDEVRGMIQTGKLSMGHARAIVSAPSPERLAKLIVEKDLTVRDAERLAAETRDGKDIDTALKRVTAGVTAEKSADTKALQDDLSRNLGMNVEIKDRGDGVGGEIKISYRTYEQLDELCRRLSSRAR
ncbi:MAG: ParB/RepB/Spo0J family partition protein [Caulobacterales bacterium]